MLLKPIIMFVICNNMREILNINMCKVYVNYKSLFIERQCYVFMSLAQSSCAVAWARCYVNKHGCRRERLCQESCTSYNPTSSFLRDD